MKKFIAALALGLSLVFAHGVSLAEDAPVKPAAEAAAPAPLLLRKPKLLHLHLHLLLQPRPRHLLRPPPWFPTKETPRG